MMQRADGRKVPAGSIKGRWLKNTLSVVIALTLVFVMVILAVVASFRYQQLRKDLIDRGKTAADFVSGHMQLEEAECRNLCLDYVRAYEQSRDMTVQFIGSDGVLIASSDGIGLGENVASDEVANAMQIRKEEVFLGEDIHTGSRIMAVYTPVICRSGEVIGVLRLSVETATVNSQIAWIALVALVFGGALVVAVVLFSDHYIRSVLGPLEEITEKAKRIAGGSYGTQIQTKYNDEIGELAGTINDLSVQINQNEKTQTEFISSLSHELRTPLTAITGWGETLLSEENMDQEQVRRGISIILREARRLTEMVVDLLDFTRIQDGRMTLNVESADIRAEFEDTVYMYGSRMAQEGISMNYVDTDEDIPEIPCDPKRMKQVFLNILDNAAKHGGSGKQIDASIGVVDGFVHICIRDYGPGIPEDEIPLVKKKFYKGSSTARGSGIGLAVCDEIVNMHGGTLDLEAATGGGTLVTVRLPLV